MFYLKLFLSIVGFNIIPFFAPSTWSVLGAVSAFSAKNFFYISLIGALGATTGRIILAKLTRLILRGNFFSEKTKENLNHINIIIERKKKSSLIFLFFFALSPLPSNQLFMAYGMTDLPLKHLVIPFFIGRLITYMFWSFAGSRLGDILDLSQSIKSFGAFFILSQVFAFVLLYFFTKINWKKVDEKLK
ncbi:hypothetical protein BH11PAT3_BH11PAT3_0720 [soil metagenome]